MTAQETSPINGADRGFAKGSPLDALNQFYAAFNHRDLNKMTASWYNSDEATIDNPIGTISRGWNEVRESYERVFGAPGTTRTELYDYSIHQYSDVFFAVGRERGEFRKEGDALQMVLNVTRIFVKVDGNWKQIHYHGSFEDPEVFAKVRVTLMGRAAKAG